MKYTEIEQLLGSQSEMLLSHKCHTIDQSMLHLPGADFVDRIVSGSNRSTRVMANMQAFFSSGRLSGSGYLSILPVDQGIEHSAGADFAANPLYFDPEHIIRLAIEGGCSGVASSFGVLAAVSRKYAHKIPFLVKLNHNELLSYPNRFNQVMFGSVKEAWNLGARAVGATIYFGSQESQRQLVEVSEAFEEAHSLGMMTVLWCYLRNDSFKTGQTDYHTAADLTGQANHIGSTIQADIIKQKLPELNSGFPALNSNGIHYGKFDPAMYDKLSTPNPIDLCRYQLLNCFMGRAGLINSGGPSFNDNELDLAAAVRSAVINKRAGGMGMISGRKAFQKEFPQGVALLNAIQGVYLTKEIDIA